MTGSAVVPSRILAVRGLSRPPRVQYFFRRGQFKLQIEATGEKVNKRIMALVR